MNVIIETINARAEETFTGSIEEFDLWAKHWFDVAESVYENFVKDELNQSAKFTRDFINETKEALAKGKKNAIRL